MVKKLVSAFLFLLLVAMVAYGQDEQPGDDLLYSIPRQLRKGIMFRIGSSIDLNEGSISRHILSFSSDVNVSGNVRGDILSLFGDVTLTETAKVDGKVVVVGGTLKSHPEAKITEDVLRLSTLDSLSGLVAFMSGVPRRYWGNIAWISWKSLLFIFMMILQIVLLAVFPRNVEAMARCSSIKLFGSAVLGLFVLLTIVPVSVVLVLSVVGIPLTFAIWSALIIAAIFGKVGLFVAISNSLFQSDKISAASVVIGYTIYRLLTFLPIVGKPIFILVNFLAVGVCIRTGFGVKQIYRRSNRPEVHRRTA
jgi:hypothetical protein